MTPQLSTRPKGGVQLGDERPEAHPHLVSSTTELGSAIPSSIPSICVLIFPTDTLFFPLSHLPNAGGLLWRCTLGGRGREWVCGDIPVCAELFRRRRRRDFRVVLALTPSCSIRNIPGISERPQSVYQQVNGLLPEVSVRRQNNQKKNKKRKRQKRVLILRFQGYTPLWTGRDMSMHMQASSAEVTTHTTPHHTNQLLVEGGV